MLRPHHGVANRFTPFGSGPSRRGYPQPNASVLRGFSRSRADRSEIDLRIHLTLPLLGKGSGRENQNTANAATDQQFRKVPGCCCPDHRVTTGFTNCNSAVHPAQVSSLGQSLTPSAVPPSSRPPAHPVLSTSGIRSRLDRRAWLIRRAPAVQAALLLRATVSPAG